MKYRILSVDDEIETLEFIKKVLISGGYSVIEATSANQAIEFARDMCPDLILLDWVMPEMSGLEVCNILKDDVKTKRIPIILLTAKAEHEDIVQGLDVGADEYVCKPFKRDELLSRIKAIIRRTDFLNLGRNGTFTTRNIKIDPEKQEVFLFGENINLTNKEYDLLYLLLLNKDKVLSKDYIFEKIWGIESDSSMRVVETLVYSLKKKLGEEGAKIIAVKKMGYKLCRDNGKLNNSEEE